MWRNLFSFLFTIWPEVENRNVGERQRRARCCGTGEVTVTLSSALSYVKSICNQVRVSHHSAALLFNITEQQELTQGKKERNAMHFLSWIYPQAGHRRGAKHSSAREAFILGGQRSCWTSVIVIGNQCWKITKAEGKYNKCAYYLVFDGIGRYGVFSSASPVPWNLINH